MTTPLFSEDVAGADELTAADLEALGVEVQPASAPSKSYIRWKPIAEKLAKEAEFWRAAAIFLGATWLLTGAALVVSVLAK